MPPVRAARNDRRARGALSDMRLELSISRRMANFSVRGGFHRKAGRREEVDRIKKTSRLPVFL
jgi:hypothetical protein